MDEEEGAKVKVSRVEKAPSKDEVMARMVNHIPCRSWREHCVKGEDNENPHRSKKVMGGGVEGTGGVG